MTITKMNKLRPQQMFLITYMNLDSPLYKVFWVFFKQGELHVSIAENNMKARFLLKFDPCT